MDRLKGSTALMVHGRFAQVKFLKFMNIIIVELFIPTTSWWQTWQRRAIFQSTTPPSPYYSVGATADTISEGKPVPVTEMSWNYLSAAAIH